MQTKEQQANRIAKQGNIATMYLLNEKNYCTSLKKLTLIKKYFFKGLLILCIDDFTNSIYEKPDYSETIKQVKRYNCKFYLLVDKATFENRYFKRYYHFVFDFPKLNYKYVIATDKATAQRYIKSKDKELKQLKFFDYNRDIETK